METQLFVEDNRMSSIENLEAGPGFSNFGSMIPTAYHDVIQVFLLLFQCVIRF